MKRTIHLYRVQQIISRQILNKKLPKMDQNMGTDAASRVVPLTEIYGASSPWGAPEFPLVSPSYNHTVLYHVPSDGTFAGDRPPRPQIGQDKWDHDHVRMPCSDQSLYPIVNEYGEKILEKRWDMIKKALTQPICNSDELAAAILTYNTKFKNIWKFQALHQLFNQYLEEEESQYFFNVTLPQITNLALQLPKLIQSPIPLLKQHKNRSISLSQQQIASLLANSFFCTFPRRNTNKKSSEYASYPYINFNSLYEASGDSTLEKLKCICHYFKRVCTKVPVGVVTVCRRSVPPAKCPQWMNCESSLASVPLHVDSENTIEDAHGLIQVDFANKFLGGGVIGHGCVQEEIRFVICPELMITMLFTEVLRPNEALMIIGSERYSKYIGYGNTFQWDGDYSDQTPRDSSGRRRTAVLAIDALPYSSVTQEYRKEFITRELNKAWVGFSMYSSEDSHSHVQFPGIASGNWGCGAFGGSAPLKCVLQLMSAARARRPLAYYTFRDSALRRRLLRLARLLADHRPTVGQLYKYIIRFTTTDVRKNDLHDFIHQAILDDARAKSDDNTTTADKNVCVNNQPDVIMSTETDKHLLQNSPDLFSQDEDPPVIQTDRNNSDNMSFVEIDPESNMAGGSEMTESSSKMAECQNSNQTSRLFYEMEKLDKGNGSLNLSSVSLSSSNLIESCEESLQATEKKRKVARKITDYFSKKNFTSL